MMTPCFSFSWVVMLAVLAVLLGAGLPSPARAQLAQPVLGAEALADDPLLEEMQRACLRFFWEQANPQTGLVADRAPADGSGKFEVASIAATGFGLTAVCVGAERGWVERDAAYERVLTTLRFLWEKMPHERGWFYHFVNAETGQRVWKCELSSIDTALLLAGALTARQCFPDTEVAELASKVYERVDFPWMLNERGVLSMGWTPERGFLRADWDGYSEHTVLYLLGLGSPTHPLPAETWARWRRSPAVVYEGMTFLACPALFTHQFSHAFVDYRGQRDGFADYWQNSVLATRAHRAMCIDELSRRYPHYSAQLWGITASDFAGGYTGWGGPPATDNIDGTVVPCAAAGSIVFTPEESLQTLRYMRDTYGETVWKHYGFVDAFNPQTGWVARDVVGIDKGITAVMIENFRSGKPWAWFMANPEVREAMRVAGFRPLSEPERSPQRFSSLDADAEAVPAEVLKGRWQGEPSTLVRRLERGWDAADWQTITASRTADDAEGPARPADRARFACLWDPEALHVRILYEADPSAAGPTAEDAQSDVQNFVELYLEPYGSDGLGHSRVDYRFRFAPQHGMPSRQGRAVGYTAEVAVTDTGYTVQAQIPWASLRLVPVKNQTLRASVSVLDGALSGPAVIRLNWRLRDSGRAIELGWLVLQ